MKRRFRLRWWYFPPLLLLLPLLVLPIGCMSFKPPPVEQTFAGRPLPDYHTYDVPGGRKIFTAETGNTAAPLVLYIHGTPGAWQDFAGMMANPALADHAFLVSADRLGWGGSAEGGIEPSLKAQAEALRAILAAHPKNLPAIVVGHSLGGPIAARLAMDSPELVGALVLVAGSIDPAQERTAWYQALGRSFVFHWMVPKVLTDADREIIPLKGELEVMVPRWGEIKIPVTIIQGTEDALVDPKNADFAETHLTSANVTMQRIPQQGHLIPWQRPDLIINAILVYVDALEKKDAPTAAEKKTP